MIMARNKAGTMNLELTYGVLNLGLGAFGSCSSFNTPPHTRQKANNVPAEQISVTIDISTKKIGIATMMPVMIVEKPGVLNFGCTLANAGGSRPSRLMLIQMRGCPS